MMSEKLEQVLRLIMEDDRQWQAKKADLFFAMKVLSDAEWEELWAYLKQEADEYLKLMYLWECICHVPDSEKYTYYLQLLKQTKVIDWNKKYFMLWQITHALFLYKGERTQQMSALMYAVYNDISEEFTAHFELEPLKERNEKLVFVTTQQFLNETHGPTKTTLDRARVLRERCGKQVIIINTAEQLGGEEIELLNISRANYYENMRLMETVEFQGVQYPYIQFDNNMPNLLNGQEFLDFVKKYRPGFIVNIGGSSLLADACSRLVPVLNINTVPSGIERTKTTMQVCGHPVSDAENALLAEIGKSAADVLAGRFTWSLKAQKGTCTRSGLGIPQDQTALAVIGGRLTEEVDADFIRMLEPVLAQGAVLVIIGVMKQYQQLCGASPVFKEHSVYLGPQEDVLAVLDCCDIYVNPRRIGGGTSVIEAMYKGLPAVSLDYGDVALGAGKEFCVADYAAMQAQLVRLMKDKAYYQEMSGKAKQRAVYMLDSDSAFVDIVNAFLEKVKG